MMVSNIPRDDLGTQRLEEANAARTATTPVAPPAASATVRPHAPPPGIPTAYSEDRRRGERRRNEARRGRDQSILLDTRSHHERRTRERRRHSAPHQALGINAYI